MAVRGDDPLKIKQRAGHTTFQTTQGYIREAEAVREGFAEVFPTLPACLLSPFGVSDRVSVSAESMPFASGSRPFEPRVAELQAAIANMTRALASASNPGDVVTLARVRDALTTELRDLESMTARAISLVPKAAVVAWVNRGPWRARLA
jgi:hypothetical protein